MAREARRLPDSCAANASTGPNRRIRTFGRLRTLFVIAGDLHCSFAALVAGRQTALFIPVAICAIRMRRLPRHCDAVCNRGEETPELVECAHF
jgi:hypothetical protein